MIYYFIIEDQYRFYLIYRKSFTHSQNAIKKIEAYEKNDIFPGERLILTFETSQSVLRNDIIETMVEKYIL